MSNVSHFPRKRLLSTDFEYIGVAQQTIVTPAANVRGLLIDYAWLFVPGSAATAGVLAAAAAAPVNYYDGLILLTSNLNAADAGRSISNLEIAAGLGLYMTPSNASANVRVVVAYRLL